MAFYDQAVGAVRGIYDRRIHTPGVFGRAFLSRRHPLHSGWTDIRREALAVAETLPRVPRFQDLMPEQTDIASADGRDWRVFVMKAYGVPVPNNLARAPTVAALLAGSAGGGVGDVPFLAPGKHIPAHRRPVRAVLRFHLMLSVPNDANGRPACELRIDGVPHCLGEGESLFVGRHLSARTLESQRPGAHRAAARRLAQGHADGHGAAVAPVPGRDQGVAEDQGRELRRLKGRVCA